MMQFLRRVNTAGLRRKRYERIARILDIKPIDRILDVGCGPGGRSVALYNSTNEIVGIDLLDEEDIAWSKQTSATSSSTRLTCTRSATTRSTSRSPSACSSTSRPRERLRAAIGETQRVARRYCFVVPHKYAFLEPHFFLPLFAVWPGWLKSFLIKRFTLGTQQRQPSGEWQRINWLSRRE